MSFLSSFSFSLKGARVPFKKSLPSAVHAQLKLHSHLVTPAILFQMFSCEFCPEKKFSTFKLCRAHVRMVHMRDRELPCKVCGKQFKDRSVVVSQTTPVNVQMFSFHVLKLHLCVEVIFRF